jgi:hypothetical protein
MMSYSQLRHRVPYTMFFFEYSLYVCSMPEPSVPKINNIEKIIPHFYCSSCAGRLLSSDLPIVQIFSYSLRLLADTDSLSSDFVQCSMTG